MLLEVCLNIKCSFVFLYHYVQKALLVWENLATFITGKFSFHLNMSFLFLKQVWWSWRLGWAWASPTQAWLYCRHVCACLLACLWTSTYRSNIYVHLSSVKKDSEGLLPESSVHVKKSQSKDDLLSFLGPTQLPVVCFDFHLRVTGTKLKMTRVWSS